MQSLFREDEVLVSQRYHDGRVRLLAKMRFGAAFLMVVGAALGHLGIVPGINTAVLESAAVFTLLFNVAVILGACPCPVRRYLSEGAYHAVIDILVVTVVLWAIGGTQAPFLSNYIFHVALVGILGGARATVIGAALALLGTLFLSIVHYFPLLCIGVWNPREPYNDVFSFVAFASVVGGVAYLTLDAVSELKRREEALRRAMQTVSLEYDVLTRTLRAIGAGLEVRATNGDIVFENPKAAALRTAAEGHSQKHADATMFSVVEEGVERVYEKRTFCLADISVDRPLEMNLYLDRTASLLEEQKLLQAERLMSLGRLAQGIAHDLNTPLSTIRTLASDIDMALAEAPPSLRNDIGENTKLITSETERLGRITRGLLAGGDLASHSKGSAQVLRCGEAMERAVALVKAGTRDLRVEIVPSEGLQTQLERSDEVVQILELISL